MLLICDPPYGSLAGGGRREEGRWAKPLVLHYVPAVGGNLTMCVCVYSSCKKVFHWQWEGRRKVLV